MKETSGEKLANQKWFDLHCSIDLVKQISEEVLAPIGGSRGKKTEKGASMKYVCAKGYLTLIAMQPLVPDHAYMPHI